MQKYYPSIQILRGTLFLLILAFHCNIPYTNLGWGGGGSIFCDKFLFFGKKALDKGIRSRSGGRSRGRSRRFELEITI